MNLSSFLVVVVLLFSSCASKYGITNAKAYVRKSVAGTIRTDDSGRPRSSGVSEEHLIFVETDMSKPLPRFTSAWVGQKQYSVQMIEINQHSIGKKTTGEEVKLTPREGHQTWQLVLAPQEHLIIADPALKEKIRDNAVVLIGIWKEKAFNYSLSKEDNLEAINFQ